MVLRAIYVYKNIIINTYVFLLYTDDPYYCGLRARVPNFVKTSKSRSKEPSTKRLSIAQMQYPTEQIHQSHHNGNGGSAAAVQQQMMFHARSYESGIGMYRNYILDPFPNRYRNYLQQNWHDENNNNNTQIYGPFTDDPSTNVIYSDTQQIQNRRNDDNTTTTTIYSNNNNNHQSTAAAANTNIIVTNNPVCVNYNNISDIYGYCSRPSSNSNPIYQCCTNSIVVTNRCGSESDLLYLTKIANQCSNNTVELSPNFTIQTIDRRADRTRSNGRIVNRSLYDDTALTSLMQRNSSFQDNFLYPCAPVNPRPFVGYQKYGGDHRQQYTTLKRNENRQPITMAYQLRRSTSTESFFGVPFEADQDTVVQTASLAHPKSGRYRKNSDKMSDKRKQAKTKKQQLVRSSSQRSAVSVTPIAQPTVIYAKDDQDLMKMARRTRARDDDMESIYGFLKPRKIRSHGIRAK